MKVVRYVALSLVVLAGCASVYALQLRIDFLKGESPHIGEFMRLPDPEELKVASLGYELLVADVLWLKAVQHMGERKISGEGYDWIYKALDTVTTLDPKFVAPYEVGGLILTIVADKVDLSNRLLEKGVENNPDVWQLPFYIGFNYFYFMKDYKKAARYIAIAAEIDGSPKYLPLLASRLYVQSEDPKYALEFLLRMYETTEDENIKPGLEKRINLLKAEIIVQELQKVVDAYRNMSGSYPADMTGLVRSGFLKSIPEEPSGGIFYLDAGGRVRSTMLTDGLILRTPGGGK